MLITKGFKYFDGEIRVTNDDSGRPCLIQFLDGEGKARDYLKIDHEKQSGTYSDKLYTAQTYDSGAVEEVHLHESAGKEQGVSFAKWLDTMCIRLLRTIAIFRIDWLLDGLEESGEDYTQPEVLQKWRETEVSQYLRSYRLFFELPQVEREQEAPLLLVGWSLCALILNEEVELALSLLKAHYKKVSDRLEDYAPILEIALADHVPPAFWNE